MDQEKKSLKSSVIHGFGTLIVREFFIKLFSFLGQVLLARLLAPSDFGVYVIIVFIINLFGLFSDIGLSLAIIQKKEVPTYLELSGAFWVKIFLSLGLMCLIWIFAPNVKVFYPAFIDTNVTMLRVFSVTLFLTSFRAIPISLLERKIKYHLISLIDIIGIFVYYVVALVGAFLHIGVWSFIMGAVIKEIIETVMIYFIQPFIPQLTFFKNDIKKLIKFGVYIQGNSLVMFFIPSITPAIGGRLSGSYAVGLLDFANSIVSLPNIVAMNFARVLFAGYSRIQEEKDLLSRSINKSVSMLAIVLYIFPVILMSFGAELVHFIYTEKWIAAVPSLYWFSAAVFFYPTITSLGQVILSIGKSKEIFWATFIIAILGWVGAYIFVKEFGFIGISMINLFIYFALYASYIYILKKANFEFSVISIIVPKLIVVICTIVFSLFLNLILPSTPPILIIKLILSIITYIIFMLIFVKSDTLELFKLILDLIRLKRI